jgi:endoglucanase
MMIAKLARLSRLLGLAALMWLGLSAAAAAQGFQPIDAAAQARRMGRGVNVLGYDPLWSEPARGRFKARHFTRIRQGGFQTIRVNLQAFAHMDASNRLDPAWLKTLDWVVDNALRNRLVVILDEHDFETCGKDPQACRPRLMAFWRQIAERYRNAPNGMLFELLNEPNTELTPALWNDFVREALAIVRQTNAQRTVVIGPGFWNSIDHLGDLQLPPNDRNIIVTVHYYLPMEFTHQGAPWSAATAKVSGITWGSQAERSRIERDFDRVQAWSRANGRPILLGEFGAYDKADMASRVRYTAAVARAAEARGWAWAYWQFDSDFIVYDIARDQWVTPIWRALIPQSEPRAGR